ncbi:MAG: folate-binding protein YgfZ [Actinobacteria bacterium]|nr:folate-binding protein YgfZ [Actinomycetota bacterium]
MAMTTPETARRQRAYVRVQGPDAVDYLDRMLSNDVPEAGSVDALLLTPKARVIAPVLVWRRGPDDVLLLTEPELGPTLLGQLTRMRFAARCEIQLEEHSSTIVLADVPGIPNRDYGRPATEVLDETLPASLDDDGLERLRIEAGTPRYGQEIDDRVLPAEAGLEARAISFSKGCYPGQEPIARQHYRGKVNRRLRVLEVAGAAPPAETPVVFGEKDVGRITSAVAGLALAYVRVEVPDDAELRVGDATASLR